MIPFQFDDLLGAPYKTHGRWDRDRAVDCYGLAIEMCRRAGTPLPDLWYDSQRMTVDKAEDDYVLSLGLEEISGPMEGCLVEMDYNGLLHVGYMVDQYNLLHTTSTSVRLSNILAVKARKFYIKRA